MLSAFISIDLVHAAPGVEIGIEQNGGIHTQDMREQILDAQKIAGAEIVRVLLRYDQVAICDPGAAGTNPNHACYDWKVFDAFIKGANYRGMKVLLSVYGVPQWKFGASPNYLGTSDAQFASFVESYRVFAQAAAQRYDGRHGLPRVEQWTIWNEPNGSFFQPRWINSKLVGPERYARLYDAGSRAIKSVDDSLRVAVGPTAPIASSLPPIEFAKETLPELQRLRSPIDGWAHNAYLGRQSPFSSTLKAPYVGLGNVSDITTLMDQYEVARGKELWITEFGYQTAVENRQLMTQEQQALLLTDAIRYAHWHPRISTFIWYSLFDDPETAGPYGFQSGLYLSANKVCDGGLCPKLALASFKRTVWVSPLSAGKITLWGEARVRRAEARLFVRRPGEAWKAYVNSTTSVSGIVQMRTQYVPGMQVALCDTECSPIRTLNIEVSGGGGNKGSVRRQRLKTVTLSRASSITRGVRYSVPCTQCTVRSVMLARGRSSGIRAARKRSVVVARARVTRSAGKTTVILRFTRSARLELMRKRRSNLLIRTTIRYKDGQVLVADRTLLLR